MDIILLILAILALMAISLLATHLWIAIWDSITGILKRIFHIKKKTINWHTLDKENQTISKDDLDQTTGQVTENEKLY